MMSHVGAGDPGGGPTLVTPEVHVGSDGWLFLRGGTNGPFDYLDGKTVFAQTKVDAWVDLLASRAKEVGRARYLHVFAPSKESVYQEEAGLTDEMSARSPLGRIYGSASTEQREVLAASALDPRPYFRQVRHKYQLFWKTDSHWSPTGCFIAYQLICAKLGVEQVPDLLQRPFGEATITMDLGRKLEVPVVERVRFYRFDQLSRRVYANPIVKLKEGRGLDNFAGLHGGSNGVFRNDAARDQRKLILFGDSFSECRAALLTGMLAETFAEVHFVWSPSLDLAYVRKHDPDFVLANA